MSFTAPITDAGEEAYAYLEPLWADDDQRGYPLKTLIAGLCEAFRYGEEVVRAQPGRDPWQQVYDITRCPDYLLPWLGQCTGSPPTMGADPDVQRVQIRAEQNFYRGTIPNLLAAAEAQQTQSGRTTILERSPNAWNIAVVYDPAATPNVEGYTQAVTDATAWALGLTVEPSNLPTFEQAAAGKTFESVASSVTFESAQLTDLQ